MKGFRERSRSIDRKSLRNRSRSREKIQRPVQRSRSRGSPSPRKVKKAPLEDREPEDPIDTNTLYNIILKGKQTNPSGQYERTTEQRLWRRLARS